MFDRLMVGGPAGLCMTIHVQQTDNDLIRRSQNVVLKRFRSFGSQGMFRVLFFFSPPPPPLLSNVNTG